MSKMKKSVVLLKKSVVLLMIFLFGCVTCSNSSTNAQKISHGFIESLGEKDSSFKEKRFREKVEGIMSEIIDSMFTEQEINDLVDLLDDKHVQSLLYVNGDIDDQIFMKALKKIRLAKTDALWRLFSDDFMSAFRTRLDEEFNGIVTIINSK